MSFESRKFSSRKAFIRAALRCMDLRQDTITAPRMEKCWRSGRVYGSTTFPGIMRECRQTSADQGSDIRSLDLDRRKRASSWKCPGCGRRALADLWALILRGVGELHGPAGDRPAETGTAGTVRLVRDRIRQHRLRIHAGVWHRFAADGKADRPTGDTYRIFPRRFLLEPVGDGARRCRFGVSVRGGAIQPGPGGGR